MQWWEVNRYLAGFHRRCHTQWETTRSLQWFLACMFNDNKKHPAPRSPQDLYKFGWEEQQQANNGPTEEEAKEIQELLAECNNGNFKW